MDFVHHRLQHYIISNKLPGQPGSELANGASNPCHAYLSVANPQQQTQTILTHLYSRCSLAFNTEHHRNLHRTPSGGQQTNTDHFRQKTQEPQTPTGQKLFICIIQQCKEQQVLSHTHTHNTGTTVVLSQRRLTTHLRKNKKHVGHTKGFRQMSR